MIIGTAGHIDHGKTALVRALTGVDTDRLPEEKRRGITIELGFAPLQLDDELIAGVVDVPGHESFVKTMVAGATGIDVALIVVAANEGIMPQTREHIAILDLLGIEHAIVAITKADLADAARVRAVGDEAAALLASTTLSVSNVIATSVATGAGITELRDALRSRASVVRARREDDLVRLPIDRIFTKPGAGTVVTGTLWSGTISVGDDVTIAPGHARGRVRALQTHGRDVNRVHPGTRVAIAIAGVPAGDVHRGDLVVTGDGWRPVTMLRADVRLLAGAEAPGPRTRVRVHLAASDVGGRIVADAISVRAHAAAPVRVMLDEPLVARGGDRFVLRRGAPMGTIGGGVVTDAAPEERRARAFASAAMSVADRLLAIADAAGSRGTLEVSLPLRLGVTPREATELTESAGLVRVGTRLISRKTFDALAGRVLAHVADYHRAHPAEAGAPIAGTRSACAPDQEVADAVLGRLKAAKAIVIDGPRVRAASWKPVRDSAADARCADVLRRLEVAGAAPPSVSELERLVGFPPISQIRALEKEGKVVALAVDRFAAAAAAQHLLDRVMRQIDRNRLYRPSELRAVFGVSRQYLIPWLEYFDRRGWTRRDGDGRRDVAAG